MNTLIAPVQGEAEDLCTWLSSCPHCRKIILSIRGHLWNPDPTEWGLIRIMLGPDGGDQEFAFPSGDYHGC